LRCFGANRVTAASHYSATTLRRHSIAALSVYGSLSLSCCPAVARARCNASASQRESSMTLRTLVLVNSKGGTGKSTLAASLAVAASAVGEKVIALDLDPQGSLVSWGNTVVVDRIDGGRLTQLSQILDTL